MRYMFIVICIVAVAVIVALLLHRKKKASHVESIPKQDEGVSLAEQENLVSQTDEDPGESVISVEVLPAESISDEGRLIEITDGKLLARINNLVPELFQAGTAGSNAVQAVKAGNEVLYRAIIPSGTKLTGSKAMEGAYRGFYRGADGIQGHANLVAVETQKGTAVAANTAAATMSVASMVVGQYYMAQINAELGEIRDGISKISSFQDNEFESRVSSLIVSIMTDFQMEIFESDGLRLLKIAELDSLEKECTKLLGHANLSLEDSAKKNELDYAAYEKELKETQKWYIYQNALLAVLNEISNLKYTLYMGKESRENCKKKLLIYKKQVEAKQKQLTRWHQSISKRLGIDTERVRRKRKGIDGVIHFIPGKWNDDSNYTPINKSTADMIEMQTSEQAIRHSYDTTDLYAEDMQLISKNGKIYYLPPDKAD